MTLEALKLVITQLPAEENAALADWLNEQETDGWDRQIRKDVSAAKRGMRIVEKVKADIRTGKFRPIEDKVHVIAGSDVRLLLGHVALLILFVAVRSA
jgi:hypothetical protein